MYRKIILILFILFTSKLEACDHCVNPSSQYNWINGRSSEFSPPMSTQVVIQHRGEQVQSLAPEGLLGLLWESKYGYVGTGCITTGMVIDGMNEKGLSFSGARISKSINQQVPQEKKVQALAIELLGKWILGNFATVDQAEEALSQVYIWEGLPRPSTNIPSLNMKLHDTHGKSLVIEFIEGNLKIYPNEESF